MTPSSESASPVSRSSLAEPANPAAGLLGPSLIVIGVSLAVNSVLGPLVLDRITYPVTDFMMNQTVGLDAANLFVVAPVFIGLGLLARSRPRLAAAFVGLLTWYALVTVAVLAMAITLVVNDDRYASTGQLILFIVVAAVVVPYTFVVARGATQRLTLSR